MYLLPPKWLGRYKSHVSNWWATIVITMHLIDSQLNTQQAYPQENVGVFVQRGRGGPLSVVEYSEMDAAMTTEINQSTGRLRYCWSNVWLYPSILISVPSPSLQSITVAYYPFLPFLYRSVCTCSLWTFWIKWQTALRRTVCEYSLVCLLSFFLEGSLLSKFHKSVLNNRIGDHISYLVLNDVL